MKKIFTVALCLMIGGIMAFGQTAKAETVKSKQSKEQYRTELENAMLGFRHGVEYSFRSFSTVGVKSAVKHGLRYQAGYRFTKHWYVGGIVGVDMTTPFTITREGFSQSSFNYEIDRKDVVYVPVMADARFYFKPRRVSTYLFTNLGAEFSSSTAAILLAGLGWDIHTVKDQCLSVSFAVGTGGWESADNELGGFLGNGDVEYGKESGFVFNIKVGYSF
ncbi:MAG: hypothetical protein IIU76_00990 [Bacteroidales bacterium]|nr:hypothetical protein [Bacteroidales bacterium]